VVVVPELCGGGDGGCLGRGGGPGPPKAVVSPPGACSWLRTSVGAVRALVVSGADASQATASLAICSAVSSSLSLCAPVKRFCPDSCCCRALLLLLLLLSGPGPDRWLLRRFLPCAANNRSSTGSCSPVITPSTSHAVTAATTTAIIRSENPFLHNGTAGTALAAAAGSFILSGQVDFTSTVYSAAYIRSSVCCPEARGAAGGCPGGLSL
jgi:hypothetical protein